jgi:hypothetical protein
VFQWVKRCAHTQVCMMHAPLISFSTSNPREFLPSTKLYILCAPIIWCGTESCGIFYLSAYLDVCLTIVLVCERTHTLSALIAQTMPFLTPPTVFGCTQKNESDGLYAYFESFGFIFILQQSNNLSNKLTLFNNK